MTKIFHNGTDFKIYISNDDWHEQNDHSHFQEKRSSYDDWLKDEFGDDSETAFWNTE